MANLEIENCKFLKSKRFLYFEGRWVGITLFFYCYKADLLMKPFVLNNNFLVSDHVNKMINFIYPSDGQ